ncbi:hypothetical protein HUB98_03840 [Paenibacillus barcinonensis]|uniref:Uncharacterized protein n=1 Tax=Paenibacillus barcinonensis TaxID=198119 RepID=A0A2V4VAV1_PAEBA|nr:hypothetical protein [Paenibacillus barcinonensis]PYE49317.1 hypothetical protein DFQ00_106303 [Paenibacillus barcinonensis]QKS55531.1 hypothetical protein HUB98_03840 [Paenibacillus barcinonensis]
MIRFIWFLLTLSGWAYLYWRTPELSAFWMYFPAGINFIMYIYGWMLERNNNLMYFFGGLLWTGNGLSLQLGEYVLTSKDFPFSMSGMVHTALIGTMFIATFLTFSNYRLAQSLLNRRGNVSKQQLVHVRPTAKDYYLKFKRLFVQNEEIVLNLGEEIPMKD